MYPTNSCGINLQSRPSLGGYSHWDSSWEIWNFDQFSKLMSLATALRYFEWTPIWWGWRVIIVSIMYIVHSWKYQQTSPDRHVKIPMLLPAPPHFHAPAYDSRTSKDQPSRAYTKGFSRFQIYTTVVNLYFSSSCSRSQTINTSHSLFLIPLTQAWTSNVVHNGTCQKASVRVIVCRDLKTKKSGEISRSWKPWAIQCSSLLRIWRRVPTDPDILHLFLGLSASHLASPFCRAFLH